MKSSFKLQSIEAEEGLRSLRSDADRTANWLRERIRKKQLGGGKRPKGVPPTKRFEGRVYKFHSWYRSMLDAKEMCFAIEAGGIGRRCQIQRTESGFYLVYRGERYQD